MKPTSSACVGARLRRVAHPYRISIVPNVNRRVGFAARSPCVSLRGRAPSALRPPYRISIVPNVNRRVGFAARSPRLVLAWARAFGASPTLRHAEKIYAFLLRAAHSLCFPPHVLLAEGRQPVTFGRWSEMRRLRVRASSAWALGWPRGQPSGPTMGFCLQWLDWRLVSGSRKLPCSGRRRADPPRPRKHGLEAETTPRRSAGRRGVSSPGDAGVRKNPFPSTVRRPALRPPSFAKRGKAQTAGGKRLAGNAKRCLTCEFVAWLERSDSRERHPRDSLTLIPGYGHYGCGGKPHPRGDAQPPFRLTP